MTDQPTNRIASGQPTAGRAQRRTRRHILGNLGTMLSASVANPFPFSVSLSATESNPFQSSRINSPARDIGVMQLHSTVMDSDFTVALGTKRKRASSEMEMHEDRSGLDREREEMERDRDELRREKGWLRRKRRRLELEEDRLQEIRDRLYQEEDRIHSMRTAGVSLFHGANHVSISGNSSFNIYYGSMGSGAWLTFVDATGRSYPVPEYLTWSYETFLAGMNFMLQGDNDEARAQRRLIKRRMYDLCIDRGNKIIAINDQESWPKVERDSKILMRIPIWQVPEEINSKRTYRCPLPRCKLWNEDPSVGTSKTIDCKGCNSRFQVSDLLEEQTIDISIPPSSPFDIDALPFLRNYHVRSVSTATEHHELGFTLNARFGETSELANLTYAADHYQKSILLKSESDPNMNASLNNMGGVLRQRFERTGNTDDLACAIEHHQRSLQLTPEGHPNMPILLHNMGSALQSCFKEMGNLADLTSAIEHHQRSLQLTPEGHPDMPTCLNNLGGALYSRFKQTGHLTDLTSAVEHHQRSVQLTPEGHPAMPTRFSNMGCALHLRFEQTGNLADLTSAIEHHQRSIQLTPEGHPDKPTCLSNMGLVLRSRFKQTGDLADLTSAIGYHQRAVQLTPDSHPDMPSDLSNLGYTLQLRFEEIGNGADHAHALKCYSKALKLIPDAHPQCNIISTRLAHLQASDRSAIPEDITS